MRNVLLFSLALLLFAGGCKQSSRDNVRVVLIALDGISVEGFEASKHPNLDRIIDDGVLSLNTRVVMPSVTLPNWTSHLTGSGPEQHGVAFNSWSLDKHPLPAVETDKDGYYPSLFQILKEQVPNIKTAFYYNWAKLIEPYNQEYLDEVSFEKGYSYIDSYKEAFNFILENKKSPTVVFLYSVHTDDAGHRYGWMSPEYIQSIEEADLHIGELIDKLKSEGLYNSTHFMFLSDHGGVDKGHGGLSLTEMEVPWAITGPGIKKGYLLNEPNNTVNTAATILHLFKCDMPQSWIGKTPMSIFK